MITEACGAMGGWALFGGLLGGCSMGAISLDPFFWGKPDSISGTLEKCPERSSECPLRHFQIFAIYPLSIEGLRSTFQGLELRRLGSMDAARLGKENAR